MMNNCLNCCCVNILQSDDDGISAYEKKTGPNRGEPS